MNNFIFIGFKTLQAVPVVFPMTRWIIPANESIFTKPKKF